MSRILVSVMPFAGHVAPVTGVVAELVNRGHEVWVFTGSRYTARFENLGALTIPWTDAPDFDEHDLAATFPAVGRRGPRGVLANLEHIFIRTGVGQARDIVRAHHATPFDAIVGDVMSSGTGLAAELLGLPWATLSIVPLSLPSDDLPPAGLALHPGFGGLGTLRDGLLRAVFQLASASLDAAFRSVRRELGLPMGKPFATALYSPWLVAVTGSPSLEYPRSDLGAQFHFVGRLPAAGRSRVQRPEWWGDAVTATTPVALVTQGTFNIDPADLIRPTLEGLADQKVMVIATTTGASGVPANARTAPFLAFDEVLPLVDVAITNGGWGGVLEALSYGIPLIVAGGGLDKPEIAARVAWSGAGIDLRTGRPRPGAVAVAYSRVTTDARFAARARAVAEELSALGGTAAAADLIERLVRVGEPVLRERSPWPNPG
ncbi:glycosyltransferase [soil metagenome]